MNIKQVLLSSLLSLTVVAGLRAEPPGVKTVTIVSYDTMKFSVNKFEAHPGQKLLVVLKNEGTLPKAVMGHNWVLLKAGADPDAYEKAAIKAHDYQPKALAGKVIASIPVLGPNETGKASFTAPSVPGTYPYLCTSLGHSMGGMRGVLIVK